MNLQRELEGAFAAFQAGRLADAEAACRRIVKAAPATGDAHHLLGIIAHRAGRTAEAVEDVARAIEANPRQAEYRNTLGAIERALGRPAAAVAHFEAALQLAPRHAQAAANLGNALAQLRRFAEAAEAYRRALAIVPGAAGVHNNLGNVLRELGQFDAAVSSFDAALLINPNYVEALANLGLALTNAERYGDAVAAFRKALAIDPNNLAALANIGNTMLVMGEHREAIGAYEQALAIMPDFPQLHLNVVAVQNYLDESSGARTLQLARRYGQGLPGPLDVPLTNVADPHRRLRVGLVSGDLRNHPVARFLRPVLAAHDPAALEFFAYSTTSIADAVTSDLKSSIHRWRQIDGLSSMAAAELIRSDSIDILIDLAGYTDRARLDVFARRAAPVQFGWLGYSGTTGVPGMDYILADRWVAPTGSEDEFSETVWRMPDSYLCFGMPDWPAPGELPAHRKGHVTFGCFNNIAKVGPNTVQSWLALLQSVPQSRLVLKSSKGGVQRRLDELEAMFVTAGIAGERLEFIDRVASQDEHLKLYDEIDIGLDPFPYNGTTTTCESLWMGVPVLTVRGYSFVARVGESLMQSMGMPGWVADDVADYVERGTRLASDLDALAEIRAGLRQRFAASPLGDVPRFTRNFEAALRQMWVEWCGP